MKVIKIKCKTALNKIPRAMPYKYDLNIYRGCFHHCEYCFAQYTHRYINEANFFDDIVFKENIDEVLRKELSRPSWKHECINIGGVCDSYQPCEKQMEMMPKILQVLIDTKTPCIISTKSNLILRDVELLNELSKVTFVGIAFSIVTDDEHIRAQLEPNASPINDRFEAIKILKSKTNALVGVNMMPILPYITDGEKQLRSFFSKLKELDVDYVIPGFLNLRGQTKVHFMDYLRKNHPTHYKLYKEIYPNAYLIDEYEDKKWPVIAALLQEYGLNTNYQKKINRKIKEIEGGFKQIGLF